MKTISKMKMTSNEGDLKDEDYLKNKDDLKNEDDLKKEDDLKNKGSLKMKTIVFLSVLGLLRRCSDYCNRVAIFSLW